MARSLGHPLTRWLLALIITLLVAWVCLPRQWACAPAPSNRPAADAPSARAAAPSVEHFGSASPPALD